MIIVNRCALCGSDVGLLIQTRWESKQQCIVSQRESAKNEGAKSFKCRSCYRRATIHAIVWKLWWERNRRVFYGERNSMEQNSGEYVGMVKGLRAEDLITNWSNVILL